MTRRTSWKRSTIGLEDTDHRVDIGLLVLRVGVSSFMLFGHGAEKLVNFGQRAASFPDPLGVGSTASLVLVVFAEFFCSLAIAFGFLTRLAAIPLIINMLVAALVIHAGDPWAKQEFALMYFLIYLGILIAGPGRCSIDRMVLRANGRD